MRYHADSDWKNLKGAPIASALSVAQIDNIATTVVTKMLLLKIFFAAKLVAKVGPVCGPPPLLDPRVTDFMQPKLSSPASKIKDPSIVATYNLDEGILGGLLLQNISFLLTTVTIFRILVAEVKATTLQSEASNTEHSKIGSELVGLILKAANGAVYWYCN